MEITRGDTLKSFVFGFERFEVKKMEVTANKLKECML